MIFRCSLAAATRCPRDFRRRQPIREQEQQRQRFERRRAEQQNPARCDVANDATRCAAYFTFHSPEIQHYISFHIIAFAVTFAFFSALSPAAKIYIFAFTLMFLSLITSSLFHADIDISAFAITFHWRHFRLSFPLSLPAFARFRCHARLHFHPRWAPCLPLPLQLLIAARHWCHSPYWQFFHRFYYACRCSLFSILPPHFAFWALSSFLSYYYWYYWSLSSIDATPAADICRQDARLPAIIFTTAPAAPCPPDCRHHCRFFIFARHFHHFRCDILSRLSMISFRHIISILAEYYCRWCHDYALCSCMCTHLTQPYAIFASAVCVSCFAIDHLPAFSFAATPPMPFRFTPLSVFIRYFAAFISLRFLFHVLRARVIFHCCRTFRHCLPTAWYAAFFAFSAFALSFFLSLPLFPLSPPDISFHYFDTQLSFIRLLPIFRFHFLSLYCRCQPFQLFFSYFLHFIFDY